MITYNHENFITEAIEGVLMQNCEFDIEFIIANDKSTDQTDQIITNYLSRIDIPKNIDIRYTNHEENKGMKLNFIWAHNEAKGKYIAYCEGDDLWIDKNKLKNQVEFLVKNKDFSMIFSDINIIDENGSIKKSNSLKNYKDVFTYYDFPFYCPSPTRVYRNIELHKKLENVELQGLDTFMLANLIGIGEIKFLKQTTSNYRVHNQGVWNSMNSLNKYSEYINTHLVCLDFINLKYSKKILIEISKRLLKIKKISSDNFQLELKKVKVKYSAIFSRSKFGLAKSSMFEIFLKLPIKDRLKFKLVRRFIRI
jgi:glycosyltransferase involved in cell wall biosynthesis